MLWIKINLKKNSTWPISLNNKEESEDNNIEKKDIDNKNDNAKEVDNNLDKDSSTT